MRIGAKREEGMEKRITRGKEEKEENKRRGTVAREREREREVGKEEEAYGRR